MISSIAAFEGWTRPSVLPLSKVGTPSFKLCLELCQRWLASAWPRPAGRGRSPTVTPFHRDDEPGRPFGDDLPSSEIKMELEASLKTLRMDAMKCGLERLAGLGSTPDAGAANRTVT